MGVAGRDRGAHVLCDAGSGAYCRHFGPLVRRCWWGGVGPDGSAVLRVFVRAREDLAGWELQCSVASPVGRLLLFDRLTLFVSTEWDEERSCPSAAGATSPPDRVCFPVPRSIVLSPCAVQSTVPA